MNPAPVYRRRRRVAVALAVTAIGAALWTIGPDPEPVHQCDRVAGLMTCTPTTTGDTQP